MRGYADGSHEWRREGSCDCGRVAIEESGVSKSSRHGAYYLVCEHRLSKILSSSLCCSRLKQGQNSEADDVKDETLAMAEELTSLRLYADLLRARLSGTVIHQQERLRHMTKRVRLYCILQRQWSMYFNRPYPHTTPSVCSRCVRINILICSEISCMQAGFASGRSSACAY